MEASTLPTQPPAVAPVNGAMEAACMHEVWQAKLMQTWPLTQASLPFARRPRLTAGRGAASGIRRWFLLFEGSHPNGIAKV